MHIYSIGMDRTGGIGLRPRSPVVSIKNYMNYNMGIFLRLPRNYHIPNIRASKELLLYGHIGIQFFTLEDLGLQGETKTYQHHAQNRRPRPSAAASCGVDHKLYSYFCRHHRRPRLKALAASYVHGLGMSLFGLGGPNIPSEPLFFGEWGPSATTLLKSRKLTYNIVLIHFPRSLLAVTKVSFLCLPHEGFILHAAAGIIQATP